MKQNDNMARICAGECPFGYDCKAMDCEECAKMHADKET
jgi:hypothetical protein